jgi:hypothetical protein
MPCRERGDRGQQSSADCNTVKQHGEHVVALLAREVESAQGR